MNIYTQVIGQVIRFGLLFLAGYLAAVGVTEESQLEIVNQLVNVLTPLALAAIAEAWSVLNKRYLYKLDPSKTEISAEIPSITPLIAIVALSAVVLTGCPGGKKIAREGREASAKISIYGKKVIQANIDAYKDGDITLEQFRQLTAVTSKFVDGVRMYRMAIDAADSAIAAGENKVTVLKRLEAVFAQQVIQKFLELAAVLKIIPGADNEHFRSIVAAIEIAISTVSVMFGQLDGELRHQEALA